MDLGSQRLVDEVNSPIYHIMLNKGWNDGILNTAFLQDCNTKSLCDTSILLFFQNLWDSVKKELSIKLFTLMIFSTICILFL